MSASAKQLCGLAAPLTLISGNWKHLAPLALSRGTRRAPSAGGCQHRSLGGALGPPRRLPPRGRADLGGPASGSGDSSPLQSLHHHPGASGSNPSWEFQTVLIPRAAAKGSRVIPFPDSVPSNILLLFLTGHRWTASSNPICKAPRRNPLLEQVFRLPEASGTA